MDAEKFVRSKFEKYTDPEGFDEDKDKSLDESQMSIISYTISVSEDGLIIKSVDKAGPSTLIVNQIVNLSFFKNLTITMSNGRYVINVYTDGPHCYSTVKIPEMNEQQESVRKQFMKFPVLRGTTLENNLEERLNRALNDLKKNYSGEGKY